MIAVLLIAAVVILAVAFLADNWDSRFSHGMSESEAADRLRSRSGSVEASPQRPPID